MKNVARPFSLRQLIIEYLDYKQLMFLSVKDHKLFCSEIPPTQKDDNGIKIG